jgi:hypothetical protein
MMTFGDAPAALCTSRRSSMAIFSPSYILTTDCSRLFTCQQGRGYRVEFRKSSERSLRSRIVVKKRVIADTLSPLP